MNKRIMLIVDDSEINCTMLSAFFEDAFIIKTAKDGRTALSILKYYGAKTSIVLLDLIMPGMDGFEVLEKMRENAEWQSIPVIVVSGQTEREAGLRAIKLGAADFVTKPVDPDWIKLKVDAAISKADSARLRAENEYMLLQRSKEAKYHTVLDSTGTVVIEYDRLNNAFQYDASISRHIAGNFDGRTLWRILMSDMIADVRDVKTMQEMVSNLANDPGSAESNITVRLKTPSNRMQWFRMRAFVSPGQAERTGTIILTFNNIDKEVESSEKLRFQAERDILTGLYNRTMFFEKAAEMIAAHKPGYYVLACFDIDKFKVVNDQFGNEKGDEVLRRVAQIFDEGFSAVGGICSRIMADDYAVLYPRALMDSHALAEIHSRASILDGDMQPLSFCVGRYIVDDLALPVSGMYDRAILAQSVAKGSFDHNIVIYEEAMRERLLREQQVTSEMKNALETEQFEVWYQPQYNHATGALIGAEALVRWRHPADGRLIPPGEFIPVFERNGFIYEMDKYVWKKTCALLRRWLDQGRSLLPISVNISRYDMLQGDIVNTLTELIERYSLPVDMLRIEITESAFSEDSDHIVRITKELIAYGFTVEIDDFGSGYSSLNTLKDAPAQVLKLDMRFLENSEDSNRGGNVLESVVRMAKWLGMAVIAEGVETIEQANYLKSIGCVYVQGYLYGKPMPIEEYEKLVRKTGKEEKLLAMETVTNLDNNAFWDPKSMDTLIFNSFVGAASIEEYHNGTVEILRISDKFVQMLGSDSMTMEDILKLDWERHFEEDSLKAYRAAVARSTETGDETTVECVFVDIPGCPPKIHLRNTLRVIASAGERYLIYCLNENITEQRAIEEKEQETNELLQAIMTNMDGGVNVSVLRDGVPKVLFANARYYETRGYTKEQYEAEVLHLSKIIHPEDREKFFHATSTAVEPFTIVYRIVRRDGAVRRLINNVSFVNLPGFNEPAQLSVSNDITELREAEEKERASAEQLQTIMANINGGVTASVVEDGVPRILFANERFYTQYGYTKEQFEAEAGNPFARLHPDDLERITRETAEASETNQPFSTVCRIIRRDGSVCWLQTNVTVIHLPGIDSPVQLAVAADITVQKELEEKERTNAQQLQAIMDNINGGVALAVMRDGYPKVIFANDQFYAQRGCTKEQYEEEYADPSRIFHADDKQKISDLARTATSPFSTVYRIVRPDEEVRWLQNNVTEVKMPGYDEIVKLSVSNDITDMVKAQQHISALSERMEAILENVDSGITASIIADDMAEYLFGNDRFFTLHGYTKAQYEAEIASPFDLICPDDRQSVMETFKRVNEVGQRTAVEYRVIRRDGIERWMRATISAQVLPDVERPVQFSVFTDVTVEKLAESKLRAANEQLQAMMDDMPGGFARLRVLPDGVVSTEYVNENICRMRGLTREEILSADGQDATGAIHPDDLDMVRSAALEMVSTGKTSKLKCRLKHANGSYNPYSAFGRVSVGEDGEKYINVYFADLSEQEKKEMTVRETVPRVLSSILASSTSLAFAKDRDFRYICASSEFVKVTNFAHESEIIGKTDHEIFPKEFADTLRNNDRKLLKTGEPMLDCVQALPLADGSLHYYKLSKYVLRDTYGNILGVYGIGRDITEEKTAYARLKLLVDSIPGGIASYIASPKGIRLSYCNDAYCNIFGYTHAEYERISAANFASLTFAEDLPMLLEQVQALIRDGKPINCTYRAHTKNGGYKWVNMQGSVAERHGDICILNGVLYDVTERKEAENELRMSEEQFRIAAAIGGRTVARYNIKTRTYQHTSSFLLDKGFDSRIENVPQAIIDAGIIAPQCMSEYLAFYDKLQRGESPCSVDIAIPGSNGAWRWLREDAHVMTDAEGNPSQAIIVFSDITELREKETVFRKWQQSLSQRPEDTYMLFRCNLSKNGSFDSAEGKLFWITFEPGPSSFNGRTQEYMNQCVYEDDRAEYLAFLNSDTLLANYYRGIHTKALEYREVLPDGTLRWLRLTVELVEYPNSTDVEAFLLFENIDTDKRDELHTKELAQTDPLTGVLNRASFSEAVERIIAEPTLTGSLAILMLDIDAFKHVNDTLGHDMGDKVLRDTADTLRSILRHGDLLGRLGGDEFLICMRDVYDDEAIGKKAEQICSLLHKSLRLDVQTSTSIGIAVCPRDGRDFVTLYRKADTALYKVKAKGKNNYAFYDESMADKQTAADNQ